jgi:hypothetical protein
VYGSVSAGTVGTAGTLAFTGAHIASEIILAIGLIFVGATMVRVSVRRRLHRP